MNYSNTNSCQFHIRESLIAYITKKRDAYQDLMQNI